MASYFRFETSNVRVESFLAASRNPLAHPCLKIAAMPVRGPLEC